MTPLAWLGILDFFTQALQELPQNGWSAFTAAIGTLIPAAIFLYAFPTAISAGFGNLQKTESQRYVKSNHVEDDAVRQQKREVRAQKINNIVTAFREADARNLFLPRYRAIVNHMRSAADNGEEQLRVLRDISAVDKDIRRSFRRGKLYRITGDRRTRDAISTVLANVTRPFGSHRNGNKQPRIRGS